MKRCIWNCSAHAPSVGLRGGLRARIDERNWQANLGHYLMETEPKRNVALEQSILGRWIFSHQDAFPPSSTAKRLGPKSTLKEVYLQTGNNFTGVVETELEAGPRNFGVFGYWDVLGNILRMGPTAADAEGLPISVNGGEMAIGADFRSYYHRMADAPDFD